MKINIVGSIASKSRRGWGSVCGSLDRRLQSLQTTVALIAIPALILATAGCSLRQEREATSPTAWAERTPASAIETAFAALKAASADSIAPREVKAQASCNDLEYS